MSHTKMDDPIIRPGLPGAFHSHEFFGNRSTDARSTPESLRASPKTSCFPRSDRSAYWVPTLYSRGKRVAAEQITVYYRVDERLAKRVVPFPAGLRMIAGNMAATRPDPRSPARWSCLGAGVPSSPSMVSCPKGSKLEFLLNFPDCWNGRDLVSGDYVSHMAYSVGGKCPKGHPVPVPKLQYKITFPLRGGPGITLASGKPFTLHGDFINAWDQRALKKRVDKCLRRSIKCDTDGLPV